MANLVPKVNNVGTLGTSSKLWNNIFHKKATFDTAIITEESNVLKVKTTPLAVEQGFSVAGSSEMVGLTLTGQLALSTQRIVNVGAPTADTDAATKAYVDSAIEGLDIKESVRAATTAAVTLVSGLENGDTIDGITLATGDRILVKDQSTASENGIYIVAASGVPTRSDDMLSSSNAAGVFVFVEEGTNNVDKGFVCTANNTADVVGTHSLAFTQFSGSNTQTSLDNIASGTSASTLTTTAGNITLDAQGSDTDIIFKGTDGVTDTTFLTLDGSDAGTALFNNDIKLSSASPKIYFGSSDELYLSATSDGLTLRANSPDQWEPKLTLLSDYDGSLGPQLFLQSNSSSPAVSDQIGNILFRGNDSGGNATTYADIRAQIADPTNSSERGSLTFNAIGGASMSLSSVTSSNKLLQLDSDTDLQFVGGGSIVGNGTGTTNIAFTINSNGQITKLGHDNPSNGQHLTWDSSNGYAVWSDVEVSADATPQLGGNLDVDGNYIVSASNGDIEVDPNGSGSFKIRGNATSGSGRLVLNCENNSHGITLKGPPHSAGANYTLTLPNNNGNANQVLKTDGSGTLSWVDQGGAVTLSEIGVGVGNTTLETSGTLEINSLHNGGNITFNVKNNGGGNYDAFKIFGQDANHGSGYVEIEGTLGVRKIIPDISASFSTLGTADYPWGNLYLADNKYIYFGNDQEIELKHDPDDGLIFKMTGSDNYDPSFVLLSDSANINTAGPKLVIKHDSPDPSNGDEVGRVEFSGRDEGGNTTTYGLLSGYSAAVTSGSEVGKIVMSPYPATTNTKGISLEGIAGSTTKVKVNIDTHNGIDSGLHLNNTLVTSSATELNMLDGATAAVATTLVDADRVIVNDDGTMKQVALSDVKTYIGAGGGASAPTVITDSSASDTTISTTSGIEEIHLISNGSTAVTITLPASATAGAGYKYNVKRLGTANVTIDGNGSETIDGSTTFVLSSQYSAITLASDGSNWFVI